MAIGEFSERSGLSPKQLRAYAASGLLVPAAVDSMSGYRFYAPGQLRDARLIEVLRRAGVPLVDIDAMLARPSSDRLDLWARRVDDQAAQSREALEQARRMLALDVSGETDEDGHPRGGRVKHFATASRSERGRVREDNQDAVVTDGRLLVVADGMGGHQGGAVASAMAVAMVDAAFTGGAGELDAAVRAANWAIWERAQASPELEGMGTTLCAAGLVQERLDLVNVGDSRAYLLRAGSVSQLTEDHSVTAELVRRGELTEEEAVIHPHRGVLTRALGVGPAVELDSRTVEVSDGDRLLLCSDGLFNEVSFEELSSLMTGTSLDTAADGLVEAALAHGGHDNVSVILAEVKGT
jgi:serine/threonine protein phosphatase PrpC